MEMLHPGNIGRSFPLDGNFAAMKNFMPRTNCYDPHNRVAETWRSRFNAETLGLASEVSSLQTADACIQP